MRRNKKYIGSPYQKRFIIKFTLFFIFLFILIIGFVLFISFDLIKSQAKSGSLSSMFWQLGLFVWQLKILVIVFFLLIFMIYLAIRFSHQIAGPLYNIEQKLEEIREGDLTANIFLRADDEVQEIADKVNAIINDFRCVIAESSSRLEELEKLLEEEKNISPQSRKEIRDKILQLKKIISRYKILKE
jgi:methyl-accepting chemotaxis protein